MNYIKNSPVDTLRSHKKISFKKLIPYLFISPWLIGFLAFYIGPMLSSFYFSFTDYDLLSAPVWSGIKNYIKIFTRDERFVKALIVTLKFVFVGIPLKLTFALILALVFNTGIKGTALYRSIYYIPSIVGGSVAVSIIWRRLFSGDGVVNNALSLFGMKGKPWISDPKTALGTLILLIIWQFGSPMLIFLAGLKQIPKELYEAASIDGANRISKFATITIPMLSPIIFFNLIMQVIKGFMAFTQSFLITRGGPADSTLFYAVYLYERGFLYFEMGYSSALAWILLLIVSALTFLLFKTSGKWVFYEYGGKK